MTEFPAQPPAKQITGTFICGHAPDYRGKLMLNASVAEWEKMFNDFKPLGVDTVIFQSALWAELEECYYQSNEFSAFKCFNSIENMLAAAQNTNIKVFLGGYGSIIGWTTRNSAPEIQAEIRKHKICLHELAKLGKVSGFYFPCETAYNGVRNLPLEQKMQQLYREFSLTVKELDSAYQVISSPCTKYCSGYDEEFLLAWSNMLKDVQLDILMPQDSIGNCGCSLPEQNDAWRLWKKLTDSCGCRLWGNIELFERKSFTNDVNLFPAAPERVAHQINNISNYTEKLCSWEMQYFTSNEAGSSGIKLYEFLKNIKN